MPKRVLGWVCFSLNFFSARHRGQTVEGDLDPYVSAAGSLGDPIP